MRVLDENGNIAEPTSRNYGKKPDPDTVRENALLRQRKLWLLIPIAGLCGYAECSKELTDRWGHQPWW